MDRILVRLRDKCVEIRAIVLKKLVGEKYKLEDTTVAQRYRLLYDGYGNKEPGVQQDTIKLFLRYFTDHPSIDAAYQGFISLF